MVSDMSMNAQKRIGGRELRRSTPEEKLTPGESLVIHKQGGKVFQLTRVDNGEKSLVNQLEELLRETPNPGKPVQTDLARIIVEDRE